MGKMQRDKGANYERELIHKINDRLGLGLKRRLGQAREAGHDVDWPLDLRLQYYLELKRRAARPAVEKYLEQALEACRGRRARPVAITRGDNGQDIVCMYLSDWLDLLDFALQQTEVL